MARMNANAGRRLVAAVVVFGCTLLFGVRLVDIQLISAPELNHEAEGKRAVPVVIPSVRGEIVDRNGAVMATTNERYDIEISPYNTTIPGGASFTRYDPNGNPEVVTAAQAFAEIGAITGQSVAEIQQIVDSALADNPRSQFAYIKRSASLDELNRLKALSVPWLFFESNYTRSYPNGAVGGNIVGFMSTDDRPLGGVELSQDACLTGVDGEETYERGADGVALPGSMVVTQPVRNGGTVQLTLDRDLQFEAQQIINEKVNQVGAEWGRLTIMNARTGELVAVAEDDSVDPSNISGSNPDKLNARSFVEPYEPGSTFKTITASALIDQGKASPTTPAEVPWTWDPEPGVHFSDSFVHGVRPWTLTGIMAQSSNVGISMLGSKLSPETRYNYLRAFGIGDPTQAGMPSEAAGLLAPVAKWDRQTAYNTMFGQGVADTIVQTAGVYQTIANGGERIPPSIVAGCIDADGSLQKFEHGDPVRVVKKETAQTVLSVLENVVNQSWITPYVSIPGYRVAGKTGTAQEVDPNTGRYRTDYVHSFVGIFPADDPQFVVAASIAFPSRGDGGVAAMQSFHDAAEATIRTFHVPPSTGKYTKYPVEH